jgi:hypothetical protein
MFCTKLKKCVLSRQYFVYSTMNIYIYIYIGIQIDDQYTQLHIDTLINLYFRSYHISSITFKQASYFMGEASVRNFFVSRAQVAW